MRRRTRTSPRSARAPPICAASRPASARPSKRRWFAATPSRAPSSTTSPATRSSPPSSAASCSSATGSPATRSRKAAPCSTTRAASTLVGASESLRLAHPVDLLAGGEWTEWQRDVFRREVVQPFKQVFRELYVPTAQELEDGKASARYAGHQVNPRQALALLGGRGWVLSPEEGVRRTFHDARLSAWLAFLEPFHTPAELEGLTLEQVIFARAR